LIELPFQGRRRAEPPRARELDLGELHALHHREHVRRVRAKDEEVVAVDPGEHAPIPPAAVAVHDRVPQKAPEDEVRVPHVESIGLTEHAEALGVEPHRRGIERRKPPISTLVAPAGDRY
jgi:hypothetical protein